VLLLPFVLPLLLRLPHKLLRAETNNSDTDSEIESQLQALLNSPWKTFHFSSWAGTTTTMDLSQVVAEVLLDVAGSTGSSAPPGKIQIELVRFIGEMQSLAWPNYQLYQHDDSNPERAAGGPLLLLPVVVQSGQHKLLLESSTAALTGPKSLHVWLTVANVTYRALLYVQISCQDGSYPQLSDAELAALPLTDSSQKKDTETVADRANLRCVPCTSISLHQLAAQGAEEKRLFEAEVCAEQCNQYCDCPFPGYAVERSSKGIIVSSVVIVLMLAITGCVSVWTYGRWKLFHGVCMCVCAGGVCVCACVHVWVLCVCVGM